MIIIKMSGGLGNQLQQYALYEKFKYQGIEARLDTSWFDKNVKKYQTRELEIKRFPKVLLELCTIDEKEKLIGKDTFKDKIIRTLNRRRSNIFRESAMYHPDLFEKRDAYLEGYWACEKYYADILPMLREKLLFPESDNPVNLDTVLKMQQECSVSVHIRRGDYLDPENEALFGNICTEDYYQSAIAFFQKKDPGTRFYLFSDDPEYVRAHFQGEEIVVVDWNKREDSFYDLYLMSMCQHHICANSTFSFWGARLNRNPEKIMIRPCKHKNTQTFDPDLMKELWTGWTFIDVDGRIL